MSELVCPTCGEQEDLRGARCDGSTDLAYSPKPLWEKGRGDQRTPVGKIPAWSCYACGGRDVTSPNPRPVPKGATS